MRGKQSLARKARLKLGEVVAAGLDVDAARSARRKPSPAFLVGLSGSAAEVFNSVPHPMPRRRECAPLACRVMSDASAKPCKARTNQHPHGTGTMTKVNEHTGC